MDFLCKRRKKNNNIGVNNASRHKLLDGMSLSVHPKSTHFSMDSQLYIPLLELCVNHSFVGKFEIVVLAVYYLDADGVKLIHVLGYISIMALGTLRI